MSCTSEFFDTLSLLHIQGLTALMYATLNNHVKVVNELILAKADPTLKSNVSSNVTYMHALLNVT